MVGLIIIGDEILNGRRTDKHLPAVIELLSKRHIPLSWVRYIPDNLHVIAENLRYAYSLDYPVFSCGGIGGTPDDMTRAAAAMAANVDVVIHPQAQEILTEKFGIEHLNANRLKMIEFPYGSTLIENPVNGIPGFKFRNVYFVPGFPEMAHPMLESLVQEGEFTRLAIPNYKVKSLLVDSVKESDLLPIMLSLVEKYPELKFSSLPSFGNQIYQFPHIDLSFSGNYKLVNQAIAELEEYLVEHNYKIIIR